MCTLNFLNIVTALSTGIANMFGYVNQWLVTLYYDFGADLYGMWGDYRSEFNMFMQDIVNELVNSLNELMFYANILFVLEVVFCIWYIRKAIKFWYNVKDKKFREKDIRTRLAIDKDRVRYRVPYSFPDYEDKRTIFKLLVFAAPFIVFANIVLAWLFWPVQFYISRFELFDAIRELFT